MPKRVVRSLKAGSWHPRMDVRGPISGTDVVVAVRLDRCVDATWYGYVHQSNEEVIVRPGNGTYHGDEILHIPDVTPLRLDEAKAMVVERVGRCEITDACALTIAGLCTALWTESPAMDLLARGEPVRMEDVADDLSANFEACGRRSGNRFDSLNMFATWMLNHPSRRAGSRS